MGQTRRYPIILHSRDIPVCEMKGTTPGPTILITAGMDGDEYTGIRAAYGLIEHFSHVPFYGTIIIVPVVNTPGFFAASSRNPRDQKYPKHIYPGNKNGTTTDKLIFWLVERYVSQASLWLDLHGGSITEQLQPFVWSYETPNAATNEKVKNIMRAMNPSLSVYEKVSRFSKPSQLAKRNCAYLIFECGQLGQQAVWDIDMMTLWVKKALQAYWGNKHSATQVTSYQNVTIQSTPFDGMWQPQNDQWKVERNEEFGTLLTLDKRKKLIAKTLVSGSILWKKAALFAKKGDDLFAIASNPITF